MTTTFHKEDHLCMPGSVYPLICVFLPSFLPFAIDDERVHYAHIYVYIYIYIYIDASHARSHFGVRHPPNVGASFGMAQAVCTQSQSDVCNVSCLMCLYVFVRLGSYATYNINIYFAASCT